MQESVTWKEMEDCLARKKSCKRMAFDLVELVNQKKGDKDNASVILIRVGEMTRENRTVILRHGLFPKREAG